MKVGKGMNSSIIIKIGRREHILEIFRRRTNVRLDHSFECGVKGQGIVKVTPS